jgi:hypothetical protein
MLADVRYCLEARWRIIVLNLWIAEFLVCDFIVGYVKN